MLVGIIIVFVNMMEDIVIMLQTWVVITTLMIQYEHNINYTYLDNKNGALLQNISYTINVTRHQRT